MDHSLNLPRCEYRTPMSEAGRFYCRHTRVHVVDHLVTAEICATCTRYRELCLIPRPAVWMATRPAIAPRPQPFEFITTEQLVADTRGLIGRLPGDLGAVAGIPRSGLLPATLLATMLHLPLFSLTADQGLSAMGNGKRLEAGGRRCESILVIDDSVNGGHAMYQARQSLRRTHPGIQAIYAAVYPRPDTAGCVDLFAREVPLPHLFEWNLFNSLQAKAIAFDFDGILCEDFLGDEHNEAEYIHFLKTARPRWLPRKHPIPLVVTARLEKYRDLTEHWLQRHGVRVQQLVMGPWRDIEERRRSFRAGSYKGEPFAASQCRLFVESHPVQAREIFEFSRRPVLCPTTGNIFQEVPTEFRLPSLLSNSDSTVPP